MTRAFVFADEAGDFAFKRGDNASRYFIVCTVRLDDCNIGADLLSLRRDMVWRGDPVGPHFHATTDKQVIRDQVYDLLAKEDFRVDATILEKAKAQPQTRVHKGTFYQYAWFYHLKGVGPTLLRDKTELLVSAAAIGTKKGQAIFTNAVNKVVQQTIQRQQWRTCFPPAAADPCLQIADYCAWALQRKWERGDERSYDLIKKKIATEYDLWRRGTVHYY